MGLMQKAVETYDANAQLVGVYRTGHEPLAPIGHVLTGADIEITLNKDGEFISARKLDKSEPKILIPVTEESGGRTSSPAAHPLCEQLKYLSGKNQETYDLYVSGLRAWADSQFGHCFLPAVLNYVESDKLLVDLKNTGLIEDLDKFDEKLFVCWRVNGFDDEDPACWKNKNLFRSFERFYSDKISKMEDALCILSGSMATVAKQHPKGIISVNGNAKLISANDSSGFTYRGRFSEDWQAATTSYQASQKAHNALRWLASEQGVREFSGNRIFLCWCPQGKTVPKVMRRLRSSDAESIRDPHIYKKALQSTMFSFREEQQIKNTDGVIIAAFDAATTGRLALTYYNEISMDMFLERMHTWDSYCCWYFGQFGIQTPNLFQLVDCAFGTMRGQFLDTDDRIQRQHLQRLLNCKVSGGVFPYDIVKALVQRASTPQAYEEKIWRQILRSACAALQKYRYDTKQGGNEMAWDLNQENRSFQYGRLLAAMEKAEADFNIKTQETRQTNAIKAMSEFRQRPFYVFERVNRHLQLAYLGRIEPWQAKRYQRVVDEIFCILSRFPQEELNKPLEDIYLMRYELQRNAFFVKKETEEKETEE